MTVKFYETADDALLKFAVIIAKYKGKWVLCKHKERETYEFPGGHREAGESILSAAERELREETGAVCFKISPVCIYSVTGKNEVNQSGGEVFGKLFYAEISDLCPNLHSEIEKIFLFDSLPDNWTYPLIQPLLLDEFMKRVVHFS